MQQTDRCRLFHTQKVPQALPTSAVPPKVIREPGIEEVDGSLCDCFLVMLFRPLTMGNCFSDLVRCLKLLDNVPDLRHGKQFSQA